MLLTTLTGGHAQTTDPMYPGHVQDKPIPDEYTDPETHLRGVHLTRFPTDYGSVVYFTYSTRSISRR